MIKKQSMVQHDLFVINESTNQCPLIKSIVFGGLTMQLFQVM